MSRPPPLPGLGQAPPDPPRPAFDGQTVLNGAIQAHGAGRGAEAERGYRLFMSIAPADARGPAHLAVLMLEQGRHEEGLALLDRTLALDPDQPDMALNRGNTLVTLGRIDEALDAYAKAIAAQPREAQGEAYNNLGVFLQQGAHHPAAVTAYVKALALDPGLAEAWGNLGIGRLALKAYGPALEALDRAVGLKPGYVDAWTNRGAALQKLGRHEEALASFDHALVLSPESSAPTNDPLGAAALNNRGTALESLGRAEEALAAFDRALQLLPDYPEAWNNRGFALLHLGRFDEARAALDRAIAVKPGYAEARWNKSLILIAEGDYVQGWPLFEARFEKEDAEPTPGDMAGAPRWTGEQPLDGKTLLVNAEQGFGDTISMLRFIPALAARGAKVVLNVQAPLIALALRAPGVDRVIEQTNTQLHIDHHVATMSLPAALGVTLGALPAETPYLSTPPEALARWAHRLGPKTRRRVGLAWSGNAEQKNDRNRSIPLETLLPLMEADVEFHSLQKDYRAADLELLKADGRIADHSAALETFADTAALIEQMDMVVTVCTSTAHLAGALAKPMLVMLTAVPDYRWGLTGDTSAWYPSAKLVRQPATGDWTPVIAEVGEALKA